MNAVIGNKTPLLHLGILFIKYYCYVLNHKTIGNQQM